jgi:acetyl-CoA synthetase
LDATSLITSHEWNGQGEPIAWQPTPPYLERSRLLRFMRQYSITSYAELCDRANGDPGWFWDSVVRDLDLRWYQPYRQVMDTSDGIEWTRWFINGQFNYVANALDKHVGKMGTGTMSPQPDHLALIWEGEEGTVRRFTYTELYQSVNQVANALRALGINKGDRVGIFMPMIPEVVMAILACGKIGAIYIPIFSGYGPESVAARLRDSGARMLITADGFYRRGKVIPMQEIANEACELSPSIEQILIVSRVGRDVALRPERDHWWHDEVQACSTECETEPTESEDPYMIIYTSGTTGKPKGAIHVHTGFPIKSAQDMAHCFDVQQDDILFWPSDIGWMMGPWAISGTLLLGATLLLYDGAPDYPGPDRLWALAEEHKSTVLGVSPTMIRALMAHGSEHVKRHDLSALRVLGSTGEPWNVDPWKWCFEHVGGGRCPIVNYSGGTEISGGILGCTTITPIKPCSFAGPVPGMAAEVVDSQGNPVRKAVGELILWNPWPGMTRGFWHDRQRYLDTYWLKLPNVWVHGDFAAIDADGFWYILGRSDDTINTAGKRLGPAEAESAAVSHPSVAEAAAIGIPHPVKGEALALFVVLHSDAENNATTLDSVCHAVVDVLGPALKPEEVYSVTQLPRTRNGKILRRLIRQAYLHQPMGDLSSVENPASLDEIAGLRGDE